jgi:hypothetical protein
MKTALQLLFLFTLIIFGCNNGNKPKTKFSKNDPFAQCMVKSENFKTNVSQNNLFESRAGTQIFLPNDAFLDNNGNPVKGEVDIEFAETEDAADMILSNLSIKEPGKIYRTEKAFFINATQNGKQLKINPANPVYIELASERPVQLYYGTRNDKGEMSWDKAQKPVPYLIPVPLEILDFLPAGFKAAVEEGLPYKTYKIISDRLVDSLYFSLSESSESYPSPNLKPEADTTKDTFKNIETDSTSKGCGINPSFIKILKEGHFQNTIISTREFETRLKAIFKTCNNRILELYVNNLNKNLWEVDSMAAEVLGRSDTLYRTFRDFSSLKQTTIKLTDKKAQFLAHEFYKQKINVELELTKLRKELQQKKEKHEKIVEEKTNEYRKLLEKRHEYRMNKFGFELTETGWYNESERITIKELKKFELKIQVANGESFDRDYIYVVNPKIKSLFSLLSEDLVHFDQVFSDDPDLLLWEGQKFNVIGVGYKEGYFAYKITEQTQKPVTNVEFSLTTGSVDQFHKDIKPFTRFYSPVNKILIDLDYHAFFFKERKRVKKEFEEQLFIRKLQSLAFPCCRIFFKMN